MHKLIITALTLMTLVVALTSCGSQEVKESDFVPPVYPPPPLDPRFIYERTIRSSFDVKEMSAMDRLRTFATGSAGSAYGLAKPFDISVFEGRIYVSDTVQRVVAMFDTTNRDFRFIGQEGQGQLLKPIGLTISKTDGTLYVADNTAKRIVAFDKNGKYLRAIGGAKLLRRPSDVAVSPDGSTLYVIDTGGVDSEQHNVRIFNSLSGELIKTVGTRGTETGEFNLPVQATVSPDGTLYVVDAGNFRIQSFSPDGKYLSSFGGIGRLSGQFSRPKGIASDDEGNIYVVDAAFGNFQIFDPSGKLLLFIGDRGNRGVPGKYMLPAGIAVDEDGRIYLTDQYFKKIDIFRPAQLAEDQGWLGRALGKRKK